jgi:hypothetical protein
MKYYFEVSFFFFVLAVDRTAGGLKQDPSAMSGPKCRAGGKKTGRLVVTIQEPRQSKQEHGAGNISSRPQTAAILGVSTSNLS